MVSDFSPYITTSRCSSDSTKNRVPTGRTPMASIGATPNGDGTQGHFSPQLLMESVPETSCRDLFFQVYLSIVTKKYLTKSQRICSHDELLVRPPRPASKRPDYPGLVFLCFYLFISAQKDCGPVSAHSHLLFAYFQYICGGMPPLSLRASLLRRKRSDSLVEPAQVGYERQKKGIFIP